MNRSDEPAIGLRRSGGELSRQTRERLTSEEALAEILSFLSRRIVLGDVDTPIGCRHLNQNFAQRDFGRRCEFVAVLLVIGPRLFVVDADLLHDLDASYLLHEHLAFKFP